MLSSIMRPVFNSRKKYKIKIANRGNGWDTGWIILIILNGIISHYIRKTILNRVYVILIIKYFILTKIFFSFPIKE